MRVRRCTEVNLIGQNYYLLTPLMRRFVASRASLFICKNASRVSVGISLLRLCLLSYLALFAARASAVVYFHSPRRLVKKPVVNLFASVLSDLKIKQNKKLFIFEKYFSSLWSRRFLSRETRWDEKRISRSTSIMLTLKVWFWSDRRRIENDIQEIYWISRNFLRFSTRIRDV